LQPVFKRNALLFAPAGGVHCTLWDTLAYLRFHLDGFDAGHPLLERAEMARLHSFYAPGTHAPGGSARPGDAHTSGGWVRLRIEGRTSLSGPGRIEDRTSLSGPGRTDWAQGALLTHSGSNTLHFARAVIAPGRQAALIAVSNAGAPEGEAAVEAVMKLLIDRLQ
jgi:hypothetical protein